MTAQLSNNPAADIDNGFSFLGLRMTRRDAMGAALFAVAILLLPLLMLPFNGSAPSTVYQIAIFGIFAIGFNILFGLTGYLSFGHAAFVGIGSYAAIWSLKLLTLNIIPALIVGPIAAGLIALPIGWLTLRRSGIYFSILTLAFSIMLFIMAFSVFKDITNGQDGQRTSQFDVRVIDDVFGWNQPVGKTRDEVTAANAALSEWNRELAALKRTNPEINGRPVDWGTLNDFTIKNMQEAGLQISTRPDQLARPSIPEFFGTPMNRGYTNFYICAVVLILTYIFATLLRQSSFGLMLLAVKTNQTRMDYMGLKPKRYTLAAFVISAMFAGLAGALFVAMDPNAPPDRMEWTESGKVVIMNILGGMGSVVGPFIGALIVKYFGNIISSIDVSRLTHTIEETLPFPAFIEWPIAHLPHLFVGEGWELGMGLVFMLMVIFLPGGGVSLWQRWTRRTKRLFLISFGLIYVIYVIDRFLLGNALPGWTMFLPLVAFVVYAIARPILSWRARQAAKRTGGEDPNAGDSAAGKEPAPGSDDSAVADPVAVLTRKPTDPSAPAPASA